MLAINLSNISVLSYMLTPHSLVFHFNNRLFWLWKGDQKIMRAQDGSFSFFQGHTEQKRTGYAMNPFSQNLFNALLLLLKVIVRYVWNWSSGTWVDWWVENFKESVLDRELDYQMLISLGNGMIQPSHKNFNDV